MNDETFTIPQSKSHTKSFAIEICKSKNGASVSFVLALLNYSSIDQAFKNKDCQCSKLVQQEISLTLQSGIKFFSLLILRG